MQTIDRTVLDLVFPPEERGDWRLEKLNYRRDMIAKVAHAIGEPQNFVCECKEGWRMGASNNAASVALQHAAWIEFDMPGAHRALSHFHYPNQGWGDKHLKFVRQTYQDSQKFLADLGVAELLVVRTMNISVECANKLGLRLHEWVDARVQLQPLSSFTLQPEMVLDKWGHQFGHMPYDNQVCVTMRATIPASRVWSVPGPGIGAKIDYEVIVLGGLFECEAIAHNGRVRVNDIW